MKERQPASSMTAITGLATMALLLILQGCSSSAPVRPEARQQPQLKQPPAEEYQRHYDNDLELALLDQYQFWKGTPYRLGGMSRRGIDCSGFVFRTFSDGLGRQLPRTTTQQSRRGFRINRRDLQTGDLVFFKTPGNKQHVGIYMDNGLFMHASTSIGVTISRLDNRYWQQSYWQSRRIPL